MTARSPHLVGLVLGFFCLVVTGCGGDKTSYTVNVDFPRDGSAVASSTITVSGRADERVTLVEVAGVAAISDDGFRHWRAEVPLSPGLNLVNVRVTDLDGQVAERRLRLRRDLAPIRKIRFFGTASPAVIVVNGLRVELSTRVQTWMPAQMPADLQGIIVDGARRRWIGFGDGSLHVRSFDGHDRDLILSDLGITEVQDLVLDPISGHVFVTSSDGGGGPIASILEIDVDAATPVVTSVSDESNALIPANRSLVHLCFDPVHRQLYGWDVEKQGIIAVPVASGHRWLVAGALPLQDEVVDMALMDDGRRIQLLDRVGSRVEIDIFSLQMRSLPLPPLERALGSGELSTSYVAIETHAGEQMTVARTDRILRVDDSGPIAELYTAGRGERGSIAGDSVRSIAYDRKRDRIFAAGGDGLVSVDPLSGDLERVDTAGVLEAQDVDDIVADEANDRILYLSNSPLANQTEGGLFAVSSEGGSVLRLAAIGDLGVTNSLSVSDDGDEILVATLDSTLAVLRTRRFDALGNLTFEQQFTGLPIDVDMPRLAGDAEAGSVYFTGTVPPHPRGVVELDLGSGATSPVHGLTNHNGFWNPGGGGGYSGPVSPPGNPGPFVARDVVGPVDPDGNSPSYPGGSGASGGFGYGGGYTNQPPPVFPEVFLAIDREGGSLVSLEAELLRRTRLLIGALNAAVVGDIQVAGRCAIDAERGLLYVPDGAGVLAILLSTGASQLISY